MLILLRLKANFLQYRLYIPSSYIQKQLKYNFNSILYVMGQVKETTNYLSMHDNLLKHLRF